MFDGLVRPAEDQVDAGWQTESCARFKGLEYLVGALLAATCLDQVVVELLNPHTDSGHPAVFHSQQFVVAECLWDTLQRDLDMRWDIEHAAHDLHQTRVLVRFVQVRCTAAEIDASQFSSGEVFSEKVSFALEITEIFVELPVAGVYLAGKETEPAPVRFCR